MVEKICGKGESVVYSSLVGILIELYYVCLSGVECPLCV